MLENPSESITRAVGEVVSKRASVFTPILILNFLVILASLIVFLLSKNLLVFAPSTLVLCYTVYIHDHFAKNTPHMLSSESVQKLGMKLSAKGLGEKGNELTELEVFSLPKFSETSQPSIEAREEGKIKEVSDAS